MAIQGSALSSQHIGGWVSGAEGTHARVHAAWGALSRSGRAVSTLAGAVLVVVCAWWAPATPLAVASGLACAALLVAAVVDAVEHRLPNVIVAVAALPVVIAIAVTLPFGSAPAIGAAGGAAVVGAPLLVAHLVSPARMGFGDVKAGVVLGAALGLIEVQVAFGALVAALAGTVLWAAARRQRHVALGPGLVAGAIAAVLVSRILGVEANPWT